MSFVIDDHDFAALDRADARCPATRQSTDLRRAGILAVDTVRIDGIGISASIGAGDFLAVAALPRAMPAGIRALATPAAAAALLDRRILLGADIDEVFMAAR